MPGGASEPLSDSQPSFESVVGRPGQFSSFELSATLLASNRQEIEWWTSHQSEAIIYQPPNDNYDDEGHSINGKPFNQDLFRVTSISRSVYQSFAKKMNYANPVKDYDRTTAEPD